MDEYQTTVHRKILVGEKLGNLVNCELFAKIYLTNIHRYTKNVFSIYALILAYLSNFSSPIAFICIAHQNFSVYGIC